MNLAEKVRETFRNCLYKPEECHADGSPPEGVVKVEGITMNFGLHPQRLEESREEVREVLKQMDPLFHKETGGGWSFLNLCQDKDGNQWTDFHMTCQELVVLAIGLKMAEYCLPREAWSALPGGVPYIMFDTEGNCGKDTRDI